MSNIRKVITIDGLAASGKSTLAQKLAQRIGFAFLSSGQIYRLVGFAALKAKIDFGNTEQVAKLFENNAFKIDLDESGANHSFLNNQDVTEYLFSPEVSDATSRLSALQEVRQALFKLQREAFPGRSLVVEGRDMGTVVFPDADLKLFINADAKVRVKRRLIQMTDGQSLTPEQLESIGQKMEIEVTERDKRDSERQLSPTIPANDAIIIDNSNQTLTEIVESMYDFVAKHGLLL